MPQPATGMSASSSSPCRVPSSPFLPCRMGRATSMAICAISPCLKSSRRRSPLLGESAAGVQLSEAAQVSFSISSTAPSKWNQRPSFVMPIRTGVYLSGFRLRITPDAEERETLYSGEQPPKKMATLSFLRQALSAPFFLSWVSVFILSSFPDFCGRPDASAEPLISAGI